jgi:hypothetical protein
MKMTLGNMTSTRKAGSDIYRVAHSWKIAGGRSSLRVIQDIIEDLLSVRLG